MSNCYIPFICLDHIPDCLLVPDPSQLSYVSLKWSVKNGITNVFSWCILLCRLSQRRLVLYTNKRGEELTHFTKGGHLTDSANDQSALSPTECLEDLYGVMTNWLDFESIQTGSRSNTWNRFSSKLVCPCCWGRQIGCKEALVGSRCFPVNAIGIEFHLFQSSDFISCSEKSSLCCSILYQCTDVCISRSMTSQSDSNLEDPEACGQKSVK